MKEQGSLRNNGFCRTLHTSGVLGNAAKALSIVLLTAAFVYAVPSASWGIAGDNNSVRVQCDDLLQRARQALNEGKLDVADTLIQQAEGMGVKYDLLYTGDTPDRLRRDLNQLRKTNAQSQDPFAIRKTDPTTASVPNPSAASTPAVSNPNSPAALAKQYLMQGRKSLNQGNLQQATAFCGEAMKLKVAYAPGEDTPEKLQKDIQTAANIMNGQMAAKNPVAPVATSVAAPVPASPVTAAVAPTAPANAASVAAMTNPAAEKEAAAKDVPVQVRRQSDKLLLDARLALATGDVAKAQSAVAQARGLNVPYGPRNDSPVKVSADIQAYQNASAAMKQSPSENNRKEFARVLVSQADTLYFLRQLNVAEDLAVSAQRLNVQYTSYDRRPEDVLEKISVAREKLAKSGQAGNVQQVAHAQQGKDKVNTADYKPAQDNSYVRQVSAIQPGQPGAVNAAEAAPGVAMQYFAQGEAALKAGNVAAARQAFTEAARYKDQLDPLTQRRLNDQLTLLPNANPIPAPMAGQGQDMVGEVTAEQQALYGKMITELVEQEGKAKQLKNTQPQEAVTLLGETRESIEKSELADAYKTRLLARVDNVINEINAYAVQNGAVIATEERNREIIEDNARQVQMKNEKEQKIAKLLDEYNELIRQQRFAEAEIKAKQAFAIDPNDRVCIQVMEIAKTQRRLAEGLRIRSQKEQGFLTALQNVDESAVPFDDNTPMQFPNAKTWEDLTKRRAREANKGPYTERELEIISKLDTPVRLDFRDTPISTVLEELANLTGVNIHIDPNGLAAAGISSDTPITIALKNDVTLKSALNLILKSKDLTYVVKDEVLQITNTSMARGQVYSVTYPVADLVIPIPNFVPSATMGLAGAYANALQALGYNGGSNLNNAIMAPATAVATRDSAKMDNPALMAQMDSGSSSGGMSNPMVPSSGAQGSLGSGSGADFDSLIELITNTVNPDSWKDNGGEGTISPFETNLSLVVSQTQEVHDKIVELLEQLRRLQDLQVTIEVRFISLSDQFYERMGVDFNFNIKSNNDGIVEVTSSTDAGTGEATQQTNFKNSATVGLSAPGVFTANMDIPVTQNNYDSVIPQFGGYTAGYGSSIGMAFLSDIEAYLFVNAAQGDQRSNILQAPKVTLFNGQQAMVSDTQQSPFVISVTPVVGDFAAAQQPVICVLSSGTFLTVQAVVSNDRRFVRLTVVPFFSEITEVNTFKFTGTDSTTTDTSTEGDASQPTTEKKSDSTSRTSSGTSVQLPTFAYQTVTTTVSVPDGGTVLLGGIKRLKEGRNEQGTPILNKIPYIERLFKNVAIGRETESLMMMVTPRIIIQEEEEERLGVVAQ